MLEERLHVDADLLVVAVNVGPGGRFASPAGAADAGEDRCEDLLAQGQQGGDGARGLRFQVVAAGPAGFGDEVLAAEFAQVVGGLPEWCSRCARSWCGPWR